MAAQLAPKDIRNVALIGDSGSGKTSLAEALLFLSGATEDRSPLLDAEPEEQQRQRSITTSLAWLTHSGCKINLIVVPGHQDFAHDAAQALRGADAAVLVVSAAEGVRDQDAQLYALARQLGLPVALFINHLDHDGADADACVQELQDVLGVRPVPLQLPLGQGPELRGVLSLFQRCAFVYDDDGSYSRQPLSPALRDDVEGAWLQLIENVAETDESLLEIYLETFTLTEEQAREAFRAALLQGNITPVLFGAATRCIGGAALLDLIIWAFPSPLQRAALTTADDEAVEPVADGPFLAQVIHSRIDDYGATRSMIRIFRGRPPTNGNLINTSRHSTEQLKNPSWLRGRTRTRATSLICGDIIAVKKLKDTRTGDTLSVNGHSVVLDRAPPPELSAAYIVRSDTLAAEAALQAALERACVEDSALTLQHDPISHLLLLRGLGPTLLDVTLARLRRREGLVIFAELPPIA
ncbi:MAG: elongation factor G, partial [Myxococcota bacterium]